MPGRTLSFCATIIMIPGILCANTWVLEGTLTPQTQPANPVNFGGAWFDQGKPIDVHGERIAVGASARSQSDTGSAYVFERDTSGRWNEYAYIEAEPNQPGFGAGVALSDEHLAVAAQAYSVDQSSNVRVYYEQGDGTYSESYLWHGGYLHLFMGATIDIEGSRIVVGGGELVLLFDNHVYFEEPHLETWEVNQQKFGVTDNNLLGTSVAIQADTMLIGTREIHDRAGSVYVTELNSNGSWGELTRIQSPTPFDSDEFGRVVDLDDDRFIVSAWGDFQDKSTTGAAYIYEKDMTGAWCLASVLKPSIDSDRFGYSVAISGDYAFVGAYSEQLVKQYEIYIYERSASGIWRELQRVDIPNDGVYMYGPHVDVDGYTAAFSVAGTVYVYTIPEPGIITLFVAACPMYFIRRNRASVQEHKITLQ